MSFKKLFIFLIFLINKAFGISTFNDVDVLEKNKLENITLNISPDSKNNHFYNPQLLEKALNESIQAFLNQYDDGYQSPLDIYYDTADLNFSMLEDKRKETINFEDFLKSEFRSLINSPETILSLIKADEDNLTNFNLSNFWIFNLKIPLLSDFSFWCVISKKDSEPPFVFGMN
tara:strand:+ start:1367 stop:1888 length:522 start_codon:yes stop_codon:yes gene_type:complete